MYASLLLIATLFAQEELNSHVRLMTGRAPEPGAFVVTAGTGDGDGFTIRSTNGVVTIAGESPRGTLYGVYELLERFGGCGWYAPWRTVVPKRARFEVPDGLDITERPAFAMRQPSWYAVRSNELFAARCRLNGEVPDGAVPHPDPKYGGCPLRFAHRLYTSHTTLVLVPPEEFYDIHPDWFAEINGRRIRDTTQLCMTNPEVIAKTAERALEFAAADPGCRVVGISQMDWGNYCTCPACSNVVAREGALSGLVLGFVNAVAERIEKERPDLLVETLAYGPTMPTPKMVRPRRNVMLCLCTNADYAEPLATCVRPRNVAWKADYERWTSWTENLYQWDYTPNFRWFFLPHPIMRHYAPNMRYFRTRGVKWIYMDGVAFPGSDFGDLRCWMLAKLAWNPEASTDDLVDRFCRGAYGAGASFARNAYDLECAKLEQHPELTLSYGAEAVPEVFDADYYRQSIALWSAAEAATADDPDACFCASLAKYPNLVAFILQLAAKAPSHSVTSCPENYVRPPELDALLADERRIRAAASARGLPLKRALQRGQETWVLKRMDELLEHRPVRASSVAIVEAKDLIVRDGDCSGGEWNERRGYHAKRLDDGSIEVYPRDGMDAVRFLLQDLAVDPGESVRVSVRVRMPERIGTAGEAFSVRAKRKSKILLDRKVGRDEVSSEWKWISVGAFVPAVGDKLDVVGAVAGTAIVRVSALRFERD